MGVSSGDSEFTAIRQLCCLVCICAVLQILNFSIAYGKTAHGLSKDFGVTLEEAQDTVRRWYSDRWAPPVVLTGTIGGSGAGAGEAGVCS
jgi:ABC-type enterobactin transport system permease subunit